MERKNLLFPFEVPFDEVQANPEAFVSAIFSSLESEFLDMPKGAGFVEYPQFEEAYEKLKKVTRGFTDLDCDRITQCAFDFQLTLIVLRSILGFTPSEWAYITTQKTGIHVTQSAARTIDRNVRLAPHQPLSTTGSTAKRISAMVETACQLLQSGAPVTVKDRLHRLDKIDTGNSTIAMRNLANMGVPYAVLLYERFLGRPFAGHRDAVSEIIGDGLETAIEDILTNAGVSFRKTRRAERIAGFDQAPDFMIPSEFNPRVVIEAKITEDDGTARDKVTRIQHLAAISGSRVNSGQQGFEVVACIGGRGFGVRREDMKKMLLATRGKVFTTKTLHYLIRHTGLRDFSSQ